MIYSTRKFYNGAKMHLFREISGVCKPTKPMSLFHPHTSYFAYFIHRIFHTSVFEQLWFVRIVLEEPGETNFRCSILIPDTLRNSYVAVFHFKGTVRPDLIYMRVVPLDRPWNEHQPLHVFDFLILVLNIWKNFKVLSRFIQNWIQPPAC